METWSLRFYIRKNCKGFYGKINKFQEGTIMMRALKDYNEMVWRPSWKWMKKHWKGYSVLLVISMIVPYLWFYWSDITEYIKNKFTKNEEES